MITQITNNDETLLGKKLLIVDLEPGLLDLSIVKHLLRKGIEVYLAQKTFTHYLKDIISANAFIKTDPFNTVELLTDVISFIQKSNICFDGVGTFSEHAVPNTAILAKTLGLGGLEPGVAFRSSNLKISMREFCRAKNIRIPRYVFLDSLTEGSLKDALDIIDGQAVIKPIVGDSSHAVFKFDSKSNLKELINKVNLACISNKATVFVNFNNKFLVESYIEGTQISVDGIVSNNTIHFAGITETIFSGPNNFTASANYIPPRISEQEVISSFAYCTEILKKFQINNSAFHCEIRLSVDGPILIEIACRAPGGRIMEGYNLAYGIDFYSAMHNLWLGLPVSLNKKHSVYLYQAGVFSEKNGILKSLHGIEIAQKSPGVHEVTPVTDVGTHVTGYPYSPIPIYYFCVEAATKKDLEDRIQKNIELVSFKIKELNVAYSWLLKLLIKFKVFIRNLY